MVQRLELYQEGNGKRSRLQSHSPAPPVPSREPSVSLLCALQCFLTWVWARSRFAPPLLTQEQACRQHQALSPKDESSRPFPSSIGSFPVLFLKVHAGIACIGRLVMGTRSCFQPFTVRNNAAKNNLIHVLFYRCVFRKESKKWDFWFKR